MTSLITSIDYSVLQTLYSARDPFFVQMFIWISELAKWPTILGLTAMVVIILIYRNRWTLAAGLITSACGALIATGVIKHLVERPRPVAEAAYFETTFSFPSSHAALAVAFYGFLLWGFWRSLPHGQQKIATSIFAIVAFLEGFGRLYLGIHYLSDVLAGYILGCIFVYLGILVVKKLEQKRSNFS